MRPPTFKINWKISLIRTKKAKMMLSYPPKLLGRGGPRIEEDKENLQTSKANNEGIHKIPTFFSFFFSFPNYRTEFYFFILFACYQPKTQMEKWAKTNQTRFSEVTVIIVIKSGTTTTHTGKNSNFPPPTAVNPHTPVKIKHSQS